MWIDRKVYEAMLLDNAKLREESRILNQQNQSLHAGLEWFMVRTTVLEKNNALLINNYMGIKLETPDYRSTPMQVAAPVPTNIPLTLGMPNNMFADMGDAEAKRNGVGWDPAGNVTQE